MEIEQTAVAAPEPVADTTPEVSSIDAAFDSVFGDDEDDAAGPVTLAEPKAEEKPAPVAPVKGPLSDPPSRFSPDAKAAWEQAPKPVKGEIKRAIAELETGLAEKNAAIEPLKPFFELAKQHGVTVHDTMDKYVRMEQLLFKDPAKGLEAIAGNMGMTLPEMLAFVQGAPQGKATPPDAAFIAVKRELDEMKRQFGEINQHVKAQNETHLLAQIDAFSADKPRFEELSGEIVRLIETGYAKDLAHAYEIAERLNPAPAAAQAAPPQAVQTRKPPRSVVGAPVSGSNPRTGVKLSDSENLDAILDQVGIR